MKLFALLSCMLTTFASALRLDGSDYEQFTMRGTDSGRAVGTVHARVHNEDTLYLRYDVVADMHHLGAQLSKHEHMPNPNAYKHQADGQGRQQVLTVPLSGVDMNVEMYISAYADVGERAWIETFHVDMGLARELKKKVKGVVPIIFSSALLADDDLAFDDAGCASLPGEWCEFNYECCESACNVELNECCVEHGKQMCSSASECCDASDICDVGGWCCLDIGVTCTDNADCCSLSCDLSKNECLSSDDDLAVVDDYNDDVACSDTGSTCIVAFDCCDAAEVCQDRKCCVDLGGTCLDNSDCCSEFCNPSNNQCWTFDDDNVILDDYIIIYDDDIFTCSTPGSTCIVDDNCCWGVCNQHSVCCQDATNGVCVSDDDCCGICVSGDCQCLALGELCNSHEGCCSRYCYPGIDQVYRCSIV